MYQLGVFLLPSSPLRWDASPSQSYMYLTTLNFPVPIYPPEWKEVVRVKCLAQEHNTMFSGRARDQAAQNSKEIQNQVICLHGQLINFKMDQLEFVIIGLQCVQRALLSSSLHALQMMTEP